MKLSEYYTLLANNLSQEIKTGGYGENVKRIFKARVDRYSAMAKTLKDAEGMESYKSLSQWKRLNKHSRPIIEDCAKKHVEQILQYSNQPLFTERQDDREFERDMYNSILISYLTQEPVEFGLFAILPQNYFSKRKAS